MISKYEGVFGSGSVRPDLQYALRENDKNNFWSGRMLLRYGSTPNKYVTWGSCTARLTLANPKFPARCWSDKRK